MTCDWYGPTPGTTVEQIAQATRARSVWAGAEHDHRADGGAVRVHAHHATWALDLDPDTILGWIAVRLDAEGDEITGTAGWLAGWEPATSNPKPSWPTCSTATSCPPTCGTASRPSRPATPTTRTPGTGPTSTAPAAEM